jgi:pyrimidine deaminase RibD-like protein
MQRNQQIDQQWMELALRQAEQSVGLASPNPAVGCVLVQGDEVWWAKASMSMTGATTPRSLPSNRRALWRAGRPPM